MSLDTAIRRFRERQESLFRDACTVTRVSEEEAEFNEETGSYSVPSPDEVYSGPCQVRPAGTQGTDVIVGEAEVRFKDSVGKLPVDTPVEVNDIFTVTGSEYDPDLVGREFRITDVLRDGRQIARVVALEEMT